MSGSASIDFVLEKLVAGDKTRSHTSNLEVMLSHLESYSASSCSASLRSSPSTGIVFDLIDIFSLEMRMGLAGELE